ncbi:MAG: GNAT family N-acetyltransferase [Desulfobacula sp.]|nr:GNAT family N-acetyltransferase [Desulfobacula sp.]
MNRDIIKIRLMYYDDFDSVVRIDKKILKGSRIEYYKQKFERLFDTGEFLPTSLVAENEKGDVIGFIMGELYIGEYGISQEGATIDTIGVDPDYRQKGIGERLLNEFIDHLRDLQVQKIITLVDKKDTQLVNYFSKNLFSQSKTVVNLERNI